jgi:uncharacterized protein YbjT (DUF2867 family)
MLRSIAKMSKTITVFGATGNQGGSVIKHILADPQLSTQFKIRAVTRDSAKPAAQELAKKGVSLVQVTIAFPLQSIPEADQECSTRPT